MTWTHIDLSAYGNVDDLHVEAGKLIAIAGKTAHEVTPKGASAIARLEPLQYSFSYKVAQTVSYLSHAGNLHFCPVGEFGFKKTVKLAYTPDADGEKIAYLHSTDNDRVLAVDNGLKLRLFSAAGDYKVLDLSSKFPKWPSAFYVGAVLKGDKIFWGNREGTPGGIKPVFSETGDRLGSANAVFQVDAVTGEVVDISENLDCRNRLNKDSGKFAQLTADYAKTRLYASTEQGLWWREFDRPGWTKFYENNGDAAFLMYPQPDGTFIVWTSGNIFQIYDPKSDTWQPLERLEQSKDLKSPVFVVHDGFLYVKYDKHPKIYCLPLPTEKPHNFTEPKLATYLGIDDAQCAVEYGDGIVLASSKALHFVNLNGQTTKLCDLNQDVNQIRVTDDRILLAGERSLQWFEEGAASPTTIIPKGSAKSRLAVGSVDEYKYAYLCDKHVTVLNSAFDIVAEVELGSTHVGDIALRGDRLFSVGFDQRKRNGVPVQIPFMHSYIIEDGIITRLLGESLWYFDPATVGNDMADGRLYSIEIVSTPDGDRATVLGESAGGNNVFRWNGRDLATPTVINGDWFSHAYNTASAHITYVGVVDLDKMVVERGQFQLCRHPDTGKGNTNRTYIAETGEELPEVEVTDPNQVEGIFYKDGVIYLTTVSTAYIPQRRVQKFAGAKLPAYTSPDVSLLRLDFKTMSRINWCTPGHGTPVLLTDKCAIVRGDKVALNVTEGGAITLTEHDTYFVAW